MLLRDPENRDQFAYRSRRLIERGLFFRGQFDLDDLLDAARAQVSRERRRKAP